MGRTAFAVIGIFIVIFAAITFMNRRQDGYETIAPEEVKGMMKEEAEFVLLDVRTPEEYREGHIKGSVLLPLNNLEEEVETEVPDQDTKIVVYCRTGRRSQTATNELLKMRYTNLYDLGGIVDWPYDTEQ